MDFRKPFLISALMALNVSYLPSAARGNDGDSPQKLREIHGRCVASLDAMQPGQRLRVWSGQCGADFLNDDEATDYGVANTADLSAKISEWKKDAPIVLSGAACQRALNHSDSCGMDTSGIYGSLKAAEVVVPLPGNRCVRYIPVLLTDKVASFSCTALRARRACVRIETKPDRTVVTLSLSRKPSKDDEAFTITASEVDEWSRTNTYGENAGRVSHTGITSGHFYLIRAGTPVRIKDERPANLTDRIRIEASRYHADCLHRHPKRLDKAVFCQKQRSYHAERLLVEAVRNDLNVVHAQSIADRVQGARSFMRFMEKHEANLTDEEWAIYNVITFNEIGLFPARDKLTVKRVYAAPYQLLDAIYDRSSLSWGAKQIDFFGNSRKRDTDPFWAKVSQAPQPLPASFLAMKDCFSSPGRTLPRMGLKTVVTDTRNWNARLGQPSLRDFHDERFLAYVRTSSETLRMLRERPMLFERSLLARVYYIDQINRLAKASI